jgi:hypothetical protein
MSIRLRKIASLAFRASLYYLFHHYNENATKILKNDAGKRRSLFYTSVASSVALVGAVSFSVYFLAGRILRRQLNTVAYVVMSYSVGAITLWLSAFLLQAPLIGFSWQGAGGAMTLLGVGISLLAESRPE